MRGGPGVGTRVVALALALAVLAVLPGCSRRRQADDGTAKPPPRAADLEALQDPSMKGARSAIEQYLDARVSGDYARVYRLLSAGSRQAYSESHLLQFFESYRSYSYDALGAPEPTDDPTWMRWPATGIKWNIAGQPPLEVATWMFTLHYEEGRWGVCLAAPLYPRAQQAFQDGNLPELDRLADQMVTIDPGEHRGYLAKAYSWLMQNEPERAVDSMQLAIWASPDELKPQVARLAGDLYQYRGEHEVAVPLYQFVVQEIPKYSNWYPAVYEADTRRFLAESLIATGRAEEALGHAVAAQVLDPFNMANHTLLASLSGG